MKRKINRTAVEYYGYSIDLMDLLKEMIGFEYTIQEARDGLLGHFDYDTREWSGMVRDLVEKRADIAITPIGVSKEIEIAVDFTIPVFGMDGIAIMMKKHRSPSTLFKFVTVLEPSVWLCILAAYVTTSFLLFIFDRYSPYSYQNNPEKFEKPEDQRVFTFKESLWFCITSLTPQGGGDTPCNISGRILVGTWWLFAFIIVASYTANLAAFLTVSRLETQILSLEDLMKQYKVKYSAVIGSFTAHYFRRMHHIEDKFYEFWKEMAMEDTLNATEKFKLSIWEYPVDDTFERIEKAIEEIGYFQNFEDAKAAVRASKRNQEGMALIGSYNEIYYAVLTSCDLQIIGDVVSKRSVALAVRKDSPLKEQFSAAINELIVTRKIEELKLKWFGENNPDRAYCEDSLEKTDGISLYGVGGVFITILVGLVMSLLALTAEQWLYKGRTDAPSHIVFFEKIANKLKIKSPQEKRDQKTQ